MSRLAIVVFCAILGFTGTAAACELATAPSSRWTTTREANGTAWLVDPCGARFYSIGVNVVDGGVPERQADGKTWYSWRAFDPTLPDWTARTKARLAEWGFNSMGGWSLQPTALALPQIPDLELGRNSKFHWFDPFDPAFDAVMMEKARELVAPYKGSPYRIGYYPDNEVGWWNGALFMFYQQKPATNFTKQRWLTYLKSRYQGDWQRFNADFIPPVDAKDWGTLLQSVQTTGLRPGSQGIQAVRGWTELVAERYYGLIEKSLRTADPDALIFGDRLPIYYDPMAVRAEARHVDVIATNYNIDSPDGWVARYFFDGLHELSGGKPVLISEWFFAANENRTGNLNNGHLMTVETQAERAAGSQEATRQFAAVSDIVGTHWFQYADNPKGGRADGEDYDFGLVDINDQPYAELTDVLKTANRAMPVEHQHATATATSTPQRQLDRKGIAVPYADINFEAKSLVDWPKQAALLPPLIASPGEVAFGEAYLSWNTDGLAVATIGQDYYDLALLAYQGPFPLDEAYRVQLGVDAGTGPHLFTLYFVPPKTVAKGFPQMTALLCRDSTAQAASCKPVDGGKIRYFGADQPRVTAEALIPWRALDLDGPPPSAQMRADITSTAWHRSRWMSLSGMSPDESRLHPDRWPALKLGRVS